MMSNVLKRGEKSKFIFKDVINLFKERSKKQIHPLGSVYLPEFVIIEFKILAFHFQKNFKFLVKNDKWVPAYQIQNS